MFTVHLHGALLWHPSILGHAWHTRLCVLGHARLSILGHAWLSVLGHAWLCEPWHALARLGVLGHLLAYPTRHAGLGHACPARYLHEAYCVHCTVLKVPA